MGLREEGRRFPRSRVCSRSSITSRSNSRSLARSLTLNGGSAPGLFSWCLFTQFRSVCGFSPSLRATSVTVPGPVRTNCTASALNSREQFRHFGFDNDFPFQFTQTLASSPSKKPKTPPSR